LGDTKTFTNAILMNGTSTNANAAVRSDRLISTGDGLSGGGNLTANRTLTVDASVIRTTGNQTLGGVKTFSSTIVGSINGNAATVTNGVYTTGNQTIGGIKTFSSTIVGSINGNAATATTLQTTRAINGTNFNGSAAITTANWGTARNITIGGTTRSVNGSTTYSWTLADIGAAASTINLTAGDGLSGGGNLTANRSFAVDSSVIRTSGNQTIGGIKTFSTFIAETTPTATTGTGTRTFNLTTGSVFTHTPGGNFTASFTNFPTTGSAAWTLRVYNGGTARTITFSQTIRWAENIKPPSSTGTDIYTFQVINNVIYGSLSIRGANA
jgi:hypothetical protein